MNINKLVNDVIPPSDYQHRNGFNNIPIIRELTEKEKQLLENALIEKLLLEFDKEFPDILIVETLAYLKSIAALPILKNLLEHCSDGIIKLQIATSIFEINQDIKMVDVAVNSVNQLANKKDAYYIYELSSAFYYLGRFKTEKTKQLIKEYTSHPEYLIAYNAKQALRGE
jgi:hypothetical protein